MRLQNEQLIYTTKAMLLKINGKSQMRDVAQHGDIKVMSNQVNLPIEIL